MLDWHWPWVVMALPLPWLTRAILRQLQTPPQAIRVPFFAALNDIDSNSSVRRQVTVASVMAAAMWVALLVAAARPVWYLSLIHI